MGGGSSSNSEYYQEQQLELSRQQMEIAKQQMELQKAQITEPEKKVDSVKQAKTDTLKEQELRRGLASAFSRDGVGQAAAQGGSATSGSSAKLGD